MIISLRQGVDMGLREEHRELTRRKVLSSVLELVAEGSLDELSVPAVARHSGVSVATIYRYFPTRAQLLAEAAAEPSHQAVTSPDRPERRPGEDDLAHHVRVMWHEFGGNLPLLRHQLASEAGREMRRARLADSRSRLSEYLAGRGIDPESQVGQRLLSMLLVVTGSVALIELHDRQGLEVDEAIECSLWALQALIDATGDSTTDGEEGIP